MSAKSRSVEPGRPIRIIPTDATGDASMTTAKECREFGAECLDWAKTAVSDEEREIFLQMARNWLYAAASLEGRLTGPDSPGQRPRPPSSIPLAP